MQFICCIKCYGQKPKLVGVVFDPLLSFSKFLVSEESVNYRGHFLHRVLVKSTNQLLAVIGHYICNQNVLSHFVLTWLQDFLITNAMSNYVQE